MEPQQPLPSLTNVAQALRSVSLPDICTAKSLAEHLSLPEAAIRTAMADGELPGRQMRDEWLVTRRALLEWLESPFNEAEAKGAGQ